MVDRDQYFDFVGDGYVGFAWETVEEILGHPHTGQPEEDETILSEIESNIGMKDHEFGEGFVDENGWYLYTN